ncbi:MAG: hypothetical protein VKJ24_08495 [Synechococcales bacterium]|nr:hypothetical protein [Synechococcales bacterium]
MQKITVLSSALLLSGWMSSAAIATPLSRLQTPLEKTTCKTALLAQAENPEAYTQERIVGKVYNVLGGIRGSRLTASIAGDDGKDYQVELSPWEWGHVGSLIGKRVIVTPIDCNRINRDTTLKFTPAQAIVVPEINIAPRTPVVPPLTPRPPVERPAPVEKPEPVIIPQTW